MVVKVGQFGDVVLLRSRQLSKAQKLRARAFYEAVFQRRRCSKQEQRARDKIRLITQHAQVPVMREDSMKHCVTIVGKADAVDFCLAVESRSP